MSGRAVNRTFRDLSEGTRISEEWLKDNLFHLIPNAIVPISNEVRLAAFNTWLRKARIVKYTKMCLHLGMSKGQANGDIDGIRNSVIIPSRGVIFFIMERDAVQLAQGHRASGRGLKGDVGAVDKPPIIEYVGGPKKAKTSGSKQINLPLPPASSKKKPKKLDDPPPPPFTYEEEHPTDLPPKEIYEMGDVWKQVKEFGKPKIVRYTSLELEY